MGQTLTRAHYTLFDKFLKHYITRQDVRK